jgi:hypothetical protein
MRKIFHLDARFLSRFFFPSCFLEILAFWDDAKVAELRAEEIKKWYERKEKCLKYLFIAFKVTTHRGAEH